MRVSISLSTCVRLPAAAHAERLFRSHYSTRANQPRLIRRHLSGPPTPDARPLVRDVLSKRKIVPGDVQSQRKTVPGDVQPQRKTVPGDVQPQRKVIPRTAIPRKAIHRKTIPRKVASRKVTTRIRQVKSHLKAVPDKPRVLNSRSKASSRKATGGSSSTSGDRRPNSGNRFWVPHVRVKEYRTFRPSRSIVNAIGGIRITTEEMKQTQQQFRTLASMAAENLRNVLKQFKPKQDPLYNTMQLGEIYHLFTIESRELSHACGNPALFSALWAVFSHAPSALCSEVLVFLDKWAVMSDKGDCRRELLAAAESLTAPTYEPFRFKPAKVVMTGAEEGKVEQSEVDEVQLEVQRDMEPQSERATAIAKLDDSVGVMSLTGAEVALNALHVEDVDVPTLSFDLSRVLFNPGIYQLRDPRSRVYNFDPYLEDIMPVTEFNYSALNQYVTSSADDKLRGLARSHEKSYVGSSSSMTSALSHFHYLISAFRPLNTSMLSKGFEPESRQPSAILRAPAAVFMRLKDGVYAMDADKEFDSGNILLSLGRSLEKLLTLDRHEYEAYRKSNNNAGSIIPEKPEQYHYGHIGKFLMRSQLDAYDSRLPGTGVFDLKTRAVASIRYNVKTPEEGMGYEIKERYGEWESYEREYFDMIRAAFTKYSLQVRIGRMDGIFVAFHNVARIFGFQYIPLPDMDLAIHGQSDTSVGDREFGFSVKMLESVIDKATAKFPGQSLRFHFEARPPTAKLEPVPYMYVFAEAMSEERIDEIQMKNKADIEAYERRLFSGEGERELVESSASITKPADDPTENDAKADEVGLSGNVINNDVEADLVHESAPTEVEEAEISDNVINNDVEADMVHKPASTNTDATRPKAAEAKRQEETSSSESPPNVVGFKVIARNEVNGQYVGRVEDITADDRWNLEYTIEEMPADKAAVRYQVCQSRRERALADSKKQVRGHPYLPILLRLSKEGAEWRAVQDSIDSDRGDPVVLYGAGQ
jgi:hypothetical protein